MEELQTAGRNTRTATSVSSVALPSLEAVSFDSAIHRPGVRRTRLVVMAVILVAQIGGCGPDSAITHSENAQIDRTAESKGVRNHGQNNVVAKGNDQLLAPDPSPNQPVTATMKVRPEILASGEAGEILVSVRIAGEYYVHAAKNPGEPWVPLAISVPLPDGLEFVGDWHVPTPQKGHGGALVYRDSALLRRGLRIGLKAAPRVVRVSGDLHYQACNDELCWPPRTIHLSAPLSIRDTSQSATAR
jgi:hypothetical protein